MVNSYYTLLVLTIYLVKFISHLKTSGITTIIVLFWIFWVAAGYIYLLYFQEYVAKIAMAATEGFVKHSWKFLKCATLINGSLSFPAAIFTRGISRVNIPIWHYWCSVIFGWLHSDFRPWIYAATLMWPWWPEQMQSDAMTESKVRWLP